MTVSEIRPGVSKDGRKHPLIEAGESGDRLAILKASLTYALRSLAAKDCPEYVKSNLLGKVQSISKEIEEIETERARGVDDGDEAPDDDWSAEVI